MADSQIVAIGGRRADAEIRRINDFVLGLTGKERPRVCFVPTAAAEDADFLVYLYAQFGGRADTCHVSFFPWPPEDLRELVLSQDVLLVPGGNTANMLAVWRVHGVDRMMREAWARGVILTGVSAGMICWFECGVTDSFGPLAALRDGLGFLPGSACPHYDGEKDRRPTYQGLVRGGFPAGYAADDGAALHFVDTDLAACVASRPMARGYRLCAESDTIAETPLSVRLLS